MVEVKIIDVDYFEILCCVPFTIDLVELFNTISEKAEVPVDQIILYTPEGVVIDRFSQFSLQTITYFKLFLYRKNSINLNYDFKEQDWKNFMSFPLSEMFDEKINFENYEVLKAPFNKIEKIEENLFINSNQARKLYAIYMIAENRFERVKKLTNFRLEAAEVLLKNIKSYYTSVKSK